MTLRRNALGSDSPQPCIFARPPSSGIVNAPRDFPSRFSPGSRSISVLEATGTSTRPTLPTDFLGACQAQVLPGQAYKRPVPELFLRCIILCYPIYERGVV